MSPGKPLSQPFFCIKSGIISSDEEEEEFTEPRQSWETPPFYSSDAGWHCVINKDCGYVYRCHVVTTVIPFKSQVNSSLYQLMVCVNRSKQMSVCSSFCKIWLNRTGECRSIAVALSRSSWSGMNVVCCSVTVSPQQAQIILPVGHIVRSNCTLQWNSSYRTGSVAWMVLIIYL